ncbi:MAG: YdcF family protein, partial [Coriobacteriales bacterium]|nr:YdcF family protein [Coriobacteriales bacterium]
MVRVVKRGLVALIVLAALGLCINFYVIASGNSRIVRDGDYSGPSDVDCVIVLGAGIWGDEPSPVLADRLAKGLELYEAGVAPKIIMSGDHGQTDYDEVNLMKSYAMERGVPS